eukprot:Sspe_Gene.25657::Locus_10356_Transcript_1_4_Confidence_0.750_Length_717::g.25657::m.25657
MLVTVLSGDMQQETHASYVLQHSSSLLSRDVALLVHPSQECRCFRSEQQPVEVTWLGAHRAPNSSATLCGYCHRVVPATDLELPLSGVAASPRGFGGACGSKQPPGMAYRLFMGVAVMGRRGGEDHHQDSHRKEA